MIDDCDGYTPIDIIHCECHKTRLERKVFFLSGQKIENIKIWLSKFIYLLTLSLFYPFYLEFILLLLKDFRGFLLWSINSLGVFIIWLNKKFLLLTIRKLYFKIWFPILLRQSFSLSFSVLKPHLTIRHFQCQYEILLKIQDELQTELFKIGNDCISTAIKYGVMSYIGLKIVLYFFDYLRSSINYEE